MMTYTWDDVAAVIELVGPKGYVHGWIKVGDTQHGYTTKPLPFRVADPNARSGKSYRTMPAGTEVYSTRTSSGMIHRLPGNRGTAFSSDPASVRRPTAAEAPPGKDDGNPGIPSFRSGKAPLSHRDPGNPGVATFRSGSRPHALQEAMSERNADNTLKAAASGRPVSAARLTALGGRPAITRLLDAGYLRKHPTRPGNLVITTAGRRHLASLQRLSP